MHDPQTLAFEIKRPWRDKPDQFFKDGYRPSWINIWHVDPEKDGTDDSCGWFPRSRHGDKEVLEKIVRRFEDDWERAWEYEEAKYQVGYFHTENGTPILSPAGITVNLFFLAAIEALGSRKKAARFMSKNLFEILYFAENPVDSLLPSLTLRYGYDGRRADRIRDMASIIYGWILRAERPWFRHPRYHFWHWKIQIYPVQDLKRFLFSRCSGCGGRFPWGYSPVATGWGGKGPQWLSGEKGVYHLECHGGGKPDERTCSKTLT